MFYLTKVTVITYWGGTLRKFFSNSPDKAPRDRHVSAGDRTPAASVIGGQSTKGVNLTIQNLYMAAPAVYGTYTLRKGWVKMWD